jgi:transposase
VIAQERDEEARAAWRAEVAGIDAERLVFLDETGVSTKLTPTYARSPRGTRAYGHIPQARHHSSTLLAALTTTGIGTSLVFRGALDRVVFDAFVDQFLVPALRPGQIVVLDNLSVHKSAHARQAITDAQCELRFLPTYSPDFNPIELANSVYKHRMRKERPRTHEEVIIASAPALAAITSDKARAFFRHAGYPCTEPNGQPL